MELSILRDGSSSMLTQLAGLLIFLLPAASLVTSYGGSGPFTALALMSLLVLPFLPGRQQLEREEKLLLLAFAAFFVWAIASMYIAGVSDDAMRRLSRYSRFFTVIPVYFLIRRLQPSAYWLLAGVIVGCIASGLYAIMQIWFDWESHYPGRASGTHHPVYFGDFSMLMAFLAIGMLRLAPSNIYKWIIVAAFCMGVLASILSGTRTAWAAAPVMLSVLIWQHWRVFSSRRKLAIVMVILLLPLTLYSLPSTNMANRINEAMQDVDRYENNVTVATSLGQRFEMWRVSWQLIKAHPWLGIGTGNFQKETGKMIDAGELTEAVRPFGNPHNEFINTMVTRGIIGLATLLAIFIVPLRIFARKWKWTNVREAALAGSGVVVVAGFVVFSLTASPFERALPASTYVFYIVIIAALLHRHGAADRPVRFRDE